MNSKKNKIFGYSQYIVIPILSALIVIILTQGFILSIKPLQELELKYIDIRFSSREQKIIQDSADVIILGISQTDYDQIPNPMNTWPWPRSYFAKVIRNLKDAGVKAVGLDILMANDDKYSPKNDEELIKAIKQSKNVVVAGELDIRAEAQYQKGNYSIVNHSYNFRNKFIAADSSIGIVQMGSDEDGIFRRYEPFVISDANNRVLPTFGFAVLNKYFGVNTNSITALKDNYFVNYGKMIPKYDKSSMLINYYGPSGSFRYFNFTDILDDDDFKTADEIYYETEINSWNDPENGLLNSGIFKDKIVLIGSTLPEDGDLHPVAFGLGKRKGDNQMWGVEIHANAIQNILWNDFLYRQSKSSEIIVVIILSLISFLIFSIFKRNKRLHPIVSEILNQLLLVLFVFSIYYLGIYLFNEKNFVMAFISPALALVAGYLSATIFSAIKILKQNAIIKGMFEHYVSKTLVDELLANPEKLSVGGEKKEITVLFSDIEGFTTISENLSPEELVEFINSYLHLMTEIVFNNEGTLDKYLGDSLMAFWGAPIDVDEQELKTCKTALLMQNKIDELKDSLIANQNKPLRVRIGIHCSKVVVGNIGGNERFDYTVMGDGVNLASRLEGANKIYGTSIMISESTYSKVADHVFVRVIDKFVVQGKTEPILVYELLGLKEDNTSNKKFKLYKSFNEGHSEYLNRNFETAKIHFENSINLMPNDKLSQIYLDRCEKFILNPPLSSWDGISHLETK